MPEQASGKRGGVVHLYALSLNEMAMLGFFFRHYDEIVDRYFIYDDGSTDGTLEMLRAHPKVECRRFERLVPDSFILSAHHFHENIWKQSRGLADWVFLTPIDEHLCHPDMAGYLERCRREGVTAIPALGYEMISRKLPAPGNKLCETITTGVPDILSSKMSIFNPAAVDSTGYTVGRHYAFPRGTIVLPPSDEVVLLHYKYIDPAYTVKRQHALALGLKERDRANRWGGHYGHSEEKILQVFAELEARTVDLGNPAYNPDRDHRGLRTWRLSKPQQRVFRCRNEIHHAATVFMNRYLGLRVLLRVLRYLRRRLAGA